jgi:hypothetical protein
VKAHLLEPKNAHRRHQTERILLAAEVDEIEPLTDTAKGSTAPYLRASLSRELPFLVERSDRTLRNALIFDADGKLYGRKIRSILTAGLVVLVMYSQVANRAVRHTPDAAIALIVEKGATNAMFLRSEKEVKAAWRRCQPVAHLAGALLQYISEKDLRCFRGEQQNEWCSDIAEFLQHAEFFQTFLQITLPGLKPKLLRTNFDLFQLPAWLGLTPSQPVPMKDIGKFVQRGSSGQRREKAA